MGVPVTAMEAPSTTYVRSIQTQCDATPMRADLVSRALTVASLQRTLTQAEPLPLEASDAMRELERAARSFRVLADYLERHPEAVIRGKKADSP